MSDPLRRIPEDDERMNLAVAEARRTLRTFFNAFVAPRRNQKSFLLKVRFDDGEQVEHVWMADINAAVFPLEGTVANEPSLPGLRYLQRASFHPTQITDWMYLEDGTLVGGYTTQAIRASLSPDERARYDADAPYKFRD